MQNIYFVVLAESRTEAEAVAEAAVLGRQFGSDLPIEVRECGTRRCIARVNRHGVLFDASPEIEFKAPPPAPDSERKSSRSPDVPLVDDGF